MDAPEEQAGPVDGTGRARRHVPRALRVAFPARLPFEEVARQQPREHRRAREGRFLVFFACPRRRHRVALPAPLGVGGGGERVGRVDGGRSLIVLRVSECKGGEGRGVRVCERARKGTGARLPTRLLYHYTTMLSRTQYIIV